MPRPSKLTPFHDLIGTVPDREISVMADVSIATVCHYRQRHNIPSYRSRLASAEPPSRIEKPPESPIATDSSWAYAVVMDSGEEVFVIAKDIVGAAKRASRSGTATRIKCLGRALV